MAKRLKFFDVKEKKSFTTSDFKVVTRMVKGNKRKFAVAMRKGTQSWRALPKDFKR